MSNTYKPDISQLFNAAFGFIPITYKVDGQPAKSGEAQYSGIEVKTEPEAKKMSWMGTPILFPMSFKGGSYQWYNSEGILVEKRLNDFELPPATVVDFRRAKNITKTNVLGNNGTVKEIYGFSDWQIRIRGLCLDEPKGLTAYEQHLELLKWEQLADSIEVVGSLFLDKEIYRLTIEDVDFKQPQGKQNMIPFEITAVSDEPLELQV